MYVCIYLSIYLPIYLSIYLFIYLSIYVCKYIYICEYLYTYNLYIYIHTSYQIFFEYTSDMKVVPCLISQGSKALDDFQIRGADQVCAAAEVGHL